MIHDAEDMESQDVQQCWRPWFDRCVVGEESQHLSGRVLTADRDGETRGVGSMTLFMSGRYLRPGSKTVAETWPPMVTKKDQVADIRLRRKPLRLEQEDRIHHSTSAHLRSHSQQIKNLPQLVLPTQRAIPATSDSSGKMPSTPQRVPPPRTPVARPPSPQTSFWKSYRTWLSSGQVGKIIFQTPTRQRGHSVPAQAPPRSARLEYVLSKYSIEDVPEANSPSSPLPYIQVDPHAAVPPPRPMQQPPPSPTTAINDSLRRLQMGEKVTFRPFHASRRASEAAGGGRLAYVLSGRDDRVQKDKEQWLSSQAGQEDSIFGLPPVRCFRVVDLEKRRLLGVQNPPGHDAHLARQPAKPPHLQHGQDQATSSPDAQAYASHHRLSAVTFSPPSPASSPDAIRRGSGDPLARAVAIGRRLRARNASLARSLHPLTVQSEVSGGASQSSSMSQQRSSQSTISSPNSTQSPHQSSTPTGMARQVLREQDSALRMQAISKRIAAKTGHGSKQQ